MTYLEQRKRDGTPLNHTEFTCYISGMKEGGVLGTTITMMAVTLATVFTRASSYYISTTAIIWIVAGCCIATMRIVLPHKLQFWIYAVYTVVILVLGTAIGLG